ncbi:MAG: fructose bisphosphate aldolase [Pseudomonadota bacterium]
MASPRSADNLDTFNAQLAKMRAAPGFIAALDQSGGSTPKALAAYGVEASAYSNDDEMFDLIHAMRTRIMTSSAFGGDRIVGAILFEQTMDRSVEGHPTPSYLWREKQVVPFLKIDKGLADEEAGAQTMKQIPNLGDLLLRAREMSVFGTKMRSVIKAANPSSVQAVVAQQFEVAQTVLDHHMVPIIEPEVDINAPDKTECEALLREALVGGLSQLQGDLPVMFKLTLPENANFYQPLIEDARSARVVALSGGYSRDVANARLAANNGIIASFSRALTEGLSAGQSDADFDATLEATIAAVAAASNT